MNIDILQKQIKAFNKAFSRADAAKQLNMDTYDAIMDLIDSERSTKSGYAKAGKKYLEKLSIEELHAYSADIEQAKNLIELQKLRSLIDTEIAEVPDLKGLLWGIRGKLIDKGLGFDSDIIRNVELGKVNTTPRQLVVHMLEYMNNPEYGISDFYEWYDKLPRME